jgi:hypothetical protein
MTFSPIILNVSCPSQCISSIISNPLSPAIGEDVRNT